MHTVTETDTIARVVSARVNASNEYSLLLPSQPPLNCSDVTTFCTVNYAKEGTVDKQLGIISPC